MLSVIMLGATMLGATMLGATMLGATFRIVILGIVAPPTSSLLQNVFLESAPANNLINNWYQIHNTLF